MHLSVDLDCRIKKSVRMCAQSNKLMWLLMLCIGFAQVARSHSSGSNSKDTERYYCLNEFGTVMDCIRCCSAYQLVGVLRLEKSVGSIRCYCERHK